MTDCRRDTGAASSQVKKSSVSKRIMGDGYLSLMTSRVCDCVWGMCWLNSKVRWPLISKSLCGDPDFKHNSRACITSHFKSSRHLAAVWMLTFVSLSSQYKKNPTNFKMFLQEAFVPTDSSRSQKMIGYLLWAANRTFFFSASNFNWRWCGKRNP